jgi:2-C-methyl-D-erythritol 4-phosphate cytidylyltransferase
MALALILAAGSGERLGAGGPKALVQLAGRPMLAWSVRALSAVPQVQRIVLVLPAGDGAPDRVRIEDLLAAEGRGEDGPPLQTVAGGAVRSESVHRGLQSCAEGDPVIVHDAARPLLSTELARRTIDALLAHPDADAAIAAVTVTDTIKRVDGAGAVLETLDRSTLWAVQTPQVFRRAALERALTADPAQLALATDDAWLVERLGGTVLVVPSERENLKVTTPLDLLVAEQLLADRAIAPDPA